MKIREAQAALNTLGYGPIAVDGVWGGQSQKALRSFQADTRPLSIDGALGPKSSAALTAALKAAGAKAKVSAGVELPWMAELARKKGLHEVHDKAALIKWLKSDGKTLGDPSKLPWCGDAVETAIALTVPDEPRPVNPYLARNWQKFGVKVDPVYGAIGVFWRGSRNGTSGHVGFIVGESADGKYWIVAGGNQSNRITFDAKIAKDRLLEARWPKSFPLTKGKLVVRSGVLSTNEA